MTRQLPPHMASVLRRAAQQTQNQELQMRDGWYSAA